MAASRYGFGCCSDGGSVSDIWYSSLEPIVARTVQSRLRGGCERTDCDRARAAPCDTHVYVKLGRNVLGRMVGNSPRGDCRTDGTARWPDVVSRRRRCMAILNPGGMLRTRCCAVMGSWPTYPRE